jgi:hypothetical protein
MREESREEEKNYQMRKKRLFLRREMMKKQNQHYEEDMPALSMMVKLRLSPEKLKTISAGEPPPSMVVKLYVDSKKLHNLQSDGRLVRLANEHQSYDADMEDVSSTSESEEL